MILSLEQALSLPYATLRFAQLGWRVIRIEPTPVPGRPTKGDPNRSIGRPVAGADRHSYFIGPNVGKEAIALNLKDAKGRELLRRLIQSLEADVFLTNTMPAHHRDLGIDPTTLRAERPELIWGSISALGTSHPDVPGYDPALQAMCGYMDLTGERDGPPTQCGPPVIDLKAGDEAFAQVLLAMLERQTTGLGKVIDISMGQAAVSWLLTFLPMLDMGSAPDQIRRNGNEHRQFIPVNAYPTQDGFIYVAIGSDAQWARITQTSMFAALKQDRWATNEGRRATKDELHQAIALLTQRHPSAEVTRVLEETAIPHAPILRVEQVFDQPFVAKSALFTTSPDGKKIRLPPPAVDIPGLAKEQPFAPAYAADTHRVLEESGLSDSEIAALLAGGVIA